MKMKSITLKLFTLTALVFLTFLIFTLLGQSLFFEKFYISKKTSDIEENLKSLMLKYSSENMDSDAKNRMLRSFTDNTGTQVAVLDQNGVYKSIYDYYLVVETMDDRLVRVPLNNSSNLEKLAALKLEKNAAVKLQGFYFGEQKDMFNMLELSSGSETWNSGIQSVYAEPAYPFVTSGRAVNLTPIPVGQLPEASINIVNIQNFGTPNTLTISAGSIKEKEALEGKVFEFALPQLTGFAAQYREELLKDAVQHWFLLSRSKSITLNSKEFIKYNYKNPINGSDNIVFVAPVFEGNTMKEMLLFMTPLQPVNEAVNTLKDFYIYIFVLALLLLLLLSLFLSKMVSKPLLVINSAAARMSKLDFSVQLPIKSEDEIGSLSRSINSLSSNLKQNIDDLKAANAKLQADIEKERQLEKMRKEFISGVSHELKTPISVISSYAEGIRDTASEDKKEKYINVILDESMKMNRLVLDMLELSKLESGHRKLSCSSFDINQLAAKVIEKFSYSFEEKEIKPRLESKLTQGFITADEEMIEQVISNLVDNAIKYSSKGSQVVITSSSFADSLEFTVENTGAHLPEDKLDKIWDKFYRIEQSRDRKSGGTGLGLSIVKDILELHGFEYGAANTEKGVKFYFKAIL